MVKKKDIENELLNYRGVHKQYQESWDSDKYMIEDKMFAFIGCNKIEVPILTIKMNPQEGAYYRESYEFISEGYYMNKVHWITITYENCDFDIIKEIVEKSYNNFLLTLPKRVQEKLK